MAGLDALPERLALALQAILQAPTGTSAPTAVTAKAAAKRVKNAVTQVGVASFREGAPPAGGGNWASFFERGDDGELYLCTRTRMTGIGLPLPNAKTGRNRTGTGCFNITGSTWQAPELDGQPTNVSCTLTVTVKPSDAAEWAKANPRPKK